MGSSPAGLPQGTKGHLAGLPADLQTTQYSMYSQYRGTRTSKGETPLGSFRARGSFAGRGSCPALNRCAGCDDVLHSSGLRVPVIPSTYTSTTDVGSTLELSWQRILPVTNVHRATGRACSRIDHPYSDSSRLRRCPRTSRAANVCPKAGTREAASDSLYILSLLGLTQEEGTDVLHRAFDASSTPVDKTQVAFDPHAHNIILAPAAMLNGTS